ncbi:putative TPR repeat methyltransferase [Povalibacter uvarum]|uniref:Putative TPR repeat methyltransferase n=1 Tax=Povalibacter uvarum TaxID=732238 RepID=A0A841HV39_9GAMM|nr:tetratricopeptide repeat protein [Povalibacter uvarum]MBB6096119.1 putative TPR repeat methyltransferase [Povalibacter uvarum]
MSTPDPVLTAAVAAHQAGRLQEAIDGYEAVLTKRPDDPDALHFFGMLHFQLGRGIDAVRLIGRSLDLLPTNPYAWNNLGNILVFQDKFKEAREAYRRVTVLAPQMAEAWFNLGVSLRDAGEFEAAVNHLYEAIRQQPSFMRAYESLGQLLYRVGDFERAAQVYRDWLARDPDNSVARHMAAATSGIDVPTRADSDYVAKLFDKYARHFDMNLKELGYRAPEVIASTLAHCLDGSSFKPVVLDAGCGTGLCGPLLRPLSTTLIGVDLSPKMVDLARERGTYDELVVADLCSFMRSRPLAFEVVVAADTYEYFGDLKEVNEAAAMALQPGGLYLFTVEALPEDANKDYELLMHGRYAHRRGYVEQSLLDTGFDVIDLRLEVLRAERMQDVAGLLAIARKRVQQ